MNCANCDTPLPTNSRFCLSCGLDLSDPGAGPRTGQIAADLEQRLQRVLEGRYRITKMLGRGGMAAVFLAEDQTLERPVAIKVLPPEVSHDENLVERFEREARTAAKLDHPNIIPIFSVEGAEDLHFFVMKYVSGQPLDEVVKGGALSTDRIQQYLWESAVALGHAHRRGVVHRDIKPANVMLDHDGRIMLTDFGISKAMQSATQLTGTGQVIGTPHYMSPEQARGGDVDGRSDQYSLGVLGYQLVTGRLPFEDGHVHALIFKHVSQDPPPIAELNPNCPPFIATAIHRALSKSPEARFESMEDFAQAICPDRRVSVSTDMRVDPIRLSDSSEVPTEIASTEDRTALQPQPEEKRSKVPLMAALVLVVGAGGFGYSQGMFDQFFPEAGDNPAVEPPPQQALAVPPPDTTTVDTSTTPDDLPTQPAPDPEPEPATTVAATPPPQDPGRPQPQLPVRPQTGLITIDATPWGTVFVNDVEIQDTPLVGHSVPVGQVVVRVTQNNCTDIVDTLSVGPGAHPRKNYVLSCGPAR